MAVEFNSFIVMPLHQHPEFMDECCRILNAEWPRSLSARRHELSKSCDELPCSLVLLRKHEEGDEVIGHSKIGFVAGQSQCCSVKSVIISNKCRGRGLGKLLMLQTESYAKSLGFKTSCLTTHDQQEFYMKLGYVECEPMAFLTSGKSSLTSQLLEKMESKKSQSNKITSVWASNEPKRNTRELTDACWPPLPPPLPTVKHISQSTDLQVTWMKKELK